MLQGACYDCHSDKTEWPWYNHIAPVSWWLADHVNDGRKRLNFSAWPHDDPSKAARKWSHVSDEVSGGTMPLSSYTWMHSAARLTAEERERFAKWLSRKPNDCARRSAKKNNNERFRRNAPCSIANLFPPHKTIHAACGSCCMGWATALKVIDGSPR